MTRRIAAVAAALLLAACTASPRIDFYSLGMPPAPSTPGATAATLTVHIGPVTVPEGVDRPQLVMRLDDSRVDIDDQHRWIEPLKNAIPRVLADALSRELGTTRVMTSRQSATLDIDYRVAVDVRHFDSSTAEVSEDVLWTIRPAKAREPRLGRTVASESVAGGIDGVAAAHARVLDRVARDIAAAIKSMESQ